MEFKNIKIKK